jgi:hypothetical protein
LPGQGWGCAIQVKQGGQQDRLGRARMRAEGLTTHLKRVFALKNETRLILSLVNVQADACRRIIGGFDQGISAASLFAP